MLLKTDTHNSPYILYSIVMMRVFEFDKYVKLCLVSSVWYCKTALFSEGDLIGYHHHVIKLIDGPERVFVAMPSRRDDQGTFRDICHPITADARKMLEERILEAYDEFMKSQESIGPIS